MATTEFGTFDGTSVIWGGGQRHSAYAGEPDAVNTLAYYRLGANQSLKEQLGTAARDLVAQNGAALSAEGLECDDVADQWAKTGLFTNLFGKTNVTVEARCRWTGGNPVDFTAPAIWRFNANNRLKAQLYSIQGGDTNPSIRVVAMAGGTGYALANYTELTAAQWAAVQAAEGCHWALDAVVNGAASSWAFYLNGELIDSWAGLMGAFDNAAGYIYVGASDAENVEWQGWVDEVRVSDTQRYAAPFTPANRHVAVEHKINQVGAITVSAGAVLDPRGISAWKGIRKGITNAGEIRGGLHGIRLEA